MTTTKTTKLQIRQTGINAPEIVNVLQDELEIGQIASFDREGVGHITLNPNGTPAGNWQCPPAYTTITYEFPIYGRTFDNISNSCPNGGIAIENRLFGVLTDGIPFAIIKITVTQP